MRRVARSRREAGEVAASATACTRRTSPLLATGTPATPPAAVGVDRMARVRAAGQEGSVPSSEPTSALTRSCDSGCPAPTAALAHDSSHTSATVGVAFHTKVVGSHDGAATARLVGRASMEAAGVDAAGAGARPAGVYTSRDAQCRPAFTRTTAPCNARQVDGGRRADGATAAAPKGEPEARAAPDPSPPARVSVRRYATRCPASASTLCARAGAAAATSVVGKPTRGASSAAKVARVGADGAPAAAASCSSAGVGTRAPTIPPPEVSLPLTPPPPPLAAPPRSPPATAARPATLAVTYCGRRR